MNPHSLFDRDIEGRRLVPGGVRTQTDEKSESIQKFFDEHNAGFEC